ncbi:MAG: GNAT family N-acetyltransferase [Bacteroidota bacterium]
MIVKELTTIDEMLKQIDIIRFLYPELSIEKYREMLLKMLPNSYGQVAIFKDNKCIAISGFWLGTKLWCGDYIELDNVVVHEDYRSLGAGKIMSDYLEEKAKSLNCTILALDAYTSNFKAHRFYYNQGYGPKGFHFVKILNKEGIN